MVYAMYYCHYKRLPNVPHSMVENFTMYVRVYFFFAIFAIVAHALCECIGTVSDKVSMDKRK